MEKSERINLRVTPDEKKAWELEAGGPRKVSEWLRRLANNEANSDWHEPSSFQKVKAVTAGSGKPAQCPRALYHRAGVYCKACGS